MQKEKSAAVMFNLSLIETDMPEPDSVAILNHIEGTQLANAFELEQKLTAENTEDYDLTPPQNTATLPAPGMR